MNAFTVTNLSHRSLWRSLLRTNPCQSKSNPRLQVRLRSSTAEAMPKIAQASTWTSIVPRFLRNRSSPTDASRQARSKEWNPATFYIVIFTLIGSQAIQMLVLRKDFENYTRRSDAKFRLLAEVIQRVKNGETVDVERLLGTDDEAKEREWEEVLQEIEDEDSLWRQKSHKLRDSEKPESNRDDTSQEVTVKEMARVQEPEKSPQAKNSSSTPSTRNVKFY